MLQKQEKSLHLSLKQTELLQNQEQMRLNIGKKLKTAGLNSRFTGSKKEVYFDLLTFEKF